MQREILSLSNHLLLYLLKSNHHYLILHDMLNFTIYCYIISVNIFYYSNYDIYKIRKKKT